MAGVQVNIASNKAALSPGATDPISKFAGVYTTHYLPSADGKNVRAGPELTITASGSGEPLAIETMPSIMLIILL